jgi:hypothetical protein
VNILGDQEVAQVRLNLLFHPSLKLHTMPASYKRKDGRSAFDSPIFLSPKRTLSPIPTLECFNLPQGVCVLQMKFAVLLQPPTSDRL